MTNADTDTLELILDRLEHIDQRLEALTYATEHRLQAKARSPRSMPTSYTADQLDALAIDAIGNVQFDVRTRVNGRFCEVPRKALFDYLTGPMELPRDDAYAVNAHIASRPEVEEFTVRRAVWYRWPEDAELFPVSQSAEVVELKPATPRRII